MKAQHTPGPWFRNGMTQINNGKDKSIAEINYADMDNDDEGKANARLIAAAPKMLEALERLARLGNGTEYGNSEGNMIARTAIAKARGEE